MRKFIVIVVVALVVLCGASFYVYKTNDASETYENKEIKNDSNMLSMMLETSAGSGEYQQTTASAWPTEGYVFNESLSKCENGSAVSWNNINKKVIIKGAISDKCYIYFDKETILLSNYIKSQYIGTQGKNNLYLHDSTLTNGAGDNSYRYAGSSDTTNNFVCFGYDSTDGTCPTDYLYRIIGVFDNEVKIIKYDFANSELLGTDGDYSEETFLKNNYSNYRGDLSTINNFYWNNNTQNNTWSESKLNTVNLNTNYLNNIGTSWANKIAISTWKVGGNTGANLTLVSASQSYQNEIVSPAVSTTYNTKVGLIYISDYGYAASPDYWTYPFFNNDKNDYRLSIKENWMFMGLSEWTITTESNNVTKSIAVGYDGNASNYYSVNQSYRAVRPTFYLKSDIKYISGTGNKKEPIIIK